MSHYILALDQGTTSSRSIVFDKHGSIVSTAQKEFRQIFPQPGWVEHDAEEIWSTQFGTMAEAVAKANITMKQVAGIGITNQRETTVVWDRNTGKPIHNAIVWQDTRTDSIINELAHESGQDRFREQTGLPLATYFSGPKIKWILDNVEGARSSAERGELLFGNMDTWLIWNLIGEHITDVTNASRTMLMNLQTLDWDDALLGAIGVPRAMLPKI